MDNDADLSSILDMVKNMLKLLEIEQEKERKNEQFIKKQFCESNYEDYAQKNKKKLLKNNLTEIIKREKEDVPLSESANGLNGSEFDKLSFDSQ